jgi:hypothetical protein
MIADLSILCQSPLKVFEAQPKLADGVLLLVASIRRARG